MSDRADARRLLVRDLAQLATPAGTDAPLRGHALGDIEVVRNAYVLCEDGRITASGPMRDLAAGVGAGDGALDPLDFRGTAGPDWIPVVPTPAPMFVIDAWTTPSMIAVVARTTSSSSSSGGCSITMWNMKRSSWASGSG